MDASKRTKKLVLTVFYCINSYSETKKKSLLLGKLVDNHVGLVQAKCSNFYRNIVTEMAKKPHFFSFGAFIRTLKKVAK